LRTTRAGTGRKIEYRRGMNYKNSIQKHQRKVLKKVFDDPEAANDFETAKKKKGKK
jgi:hypothetical protein